MSDRAESQCKRCHGRGYILIPCKVCGTHTGTHWHDHCPPMEREPCKACWETGIQGTTDGPLQPGDPVFIFGIPDEAKPEIVKKANGCQGRVIAVDQEGDGDFYHVQVQDGPMMGNILALHRDQVYGRRPIQPEPGIIRDYAATEALAEQRGEWPRKPPYDDGCRCTNDGQYGRVHTDKCPVHGPPLSIQQAADALRQSEEIQRAKNREKIEREDGEMAPMPTNKQLEEFLKPVWMRFQNRERWALSAHMDDGSLWFCARLIGTDISIERGNPSSLVEHVNAVKLS